MAGCRDPPGWPQLPPKHTLPAGKATGPLPHALMDPPCLCGRPSCTALLRRHSEKPPEAGVFCEALTATTAGARPFPQQVPAFTSIPDLRESPCIPSLTQPQSLGGQQAGMAISSGLRGHPRPGRRGSQVRSRSPSAEQQEQPHPAGGRLAALGPRGPTSVTQAHTAPSH